MIKATLYTLAFLFPIILVQAQDTALLGNYLLAHRYSVDINSEHAFAMLPGMMVGKNLFILGEGGHHDLELYDNLKPAILSQLAQHNLKYFFVEMGRSTAILLDKYLHNETADCHSAYKHGCAAIKQEQSKLRREHDFKVVGIDFEIRIDFHTEMNNLFGQIDLSKTPVSNAFLANLLDSTSLKMTHKNFMKFYRKKRKEFYSSQVALKQELGDKYNELERLMTNQNTTRPYIDRNPALTRNLLHEITPIDTSAIYFLAIGNAHTFPFRHSTVVYKLGKNEQLKNRILLMNLHCENCTVDGKKLESEAILKFLKHSDILTCFNNAANSDMVLFDLRQLPDEFSHIRKYGDLLLFARNQH